MNKLINIQNKNLKNKNIFYFLLLAGFCLRLYLSMYGTFEADFFEFKKWAFGINNIGFDRFYEKIWCDYMPLYLYILYVIQKVSLIIPADYQVILFKLPSILADLSISLLIYYFIRNRFNIKAAVLGSLLYFYNPASISNSTLWGQIDAFHLLPVLIALLFLLKEHYIMSNLFILISFLIKAQSIVILPFFILVYFLDKYRTDNFKIIISNMLRYFIKNIIIFYIVIFLVSLPFIYSEITNGNILDIIIQPLAFIKSRFLFGYSTYQYTSANAFNVWAIIDGLWKSDQRIFLSMSLQQWGTILFLIPYIAMLLGFAYFNIKSRDMIDSNQYYLIVLANILIFFSLFLFVTRVHERHFLPVILFSSLVLFRSTLYIYLYILISIFYCINMLYAYYYDVPGLYFNSTNLNPFIPTISLSCLLVFIYFLIDYIKLCTNRREE